MKLRGLIFWFNVLFLNLLESINFVLNFCWLVNFFIVEILYNGDFLLVWFVVVVL